MRLYVATLRSVTDGDIMDYEDRDVAAPSMRGLRPEMLRWGDATWVIREYVVAKLPLRKLVAALYNRAFWAAADLRT